MTLGNILAGVLQGVLSGQAQGGQGLGAQGMGAQAMGGQANPLAAVLAALLTPQQGPAAQAFGAGGADDLLSQFRGAGYANEVESWVGTGPNKSIEPQAIETVFGREKLGAMAQEAGLPQQDLMSGLARMLPEVINGLSPQGRLPAQGAGMDQMLASVLGQFLGGRR
jgi:uncharacterized protein YidB (DUF937 family)